MRFFEDFDVGETWETGSRSLSEEDILRFANEYDWQYFHTDPEAAKASPYGGLIASGFQTLLTAFGLVLKVRSWGEAGMGSPGMDTVRWLAPVRPGDTLTVRVEVISTRPSRSKPDRGLVTFGHTVVNQTGEAVMTYDTMVMIRRREPALPEDDATD
ncbi:MAG: MaoC family dehydratase [Pseudomonadota bacterium]